MTPLEVLRVFADNLGWQVRADGPNRSQLVELDRGALVVLAVLSTRGGTYPVKLTFSKLEIPDVFAREAQSFQERLSQLKELEAFRQIVVIKEAVHRAT